MRFLQNWFETLWYSENKKSIFNVLLYPVSFLYQALAEKRRAKFLSGQSSGSAVACPVVVVGNITVGGTGKTPLVIWLAEQLQLQGYKPGIISRGYGGKAKDFPIQVSFDSDPGYVGDEPAMMARRLNNVPVVIDPNRVRGSVYLNENLGCNIVVSDDGLQHYNLKRDIEIAVIDGKRGLGNGKCLPAGPLRESASRLKSVDFVVINSDKGLIDLDTDRISGVSSEILANSIQMKLLPEKINLLVGQPSEKPPIVFEVKDLNCPVHAVAGIGNPGRFFDTLESMGILFQMHPFPDHYSYQASDIIFTDRKDVVMTEKDAIKCCSIVASEKTRCFYLTISADLDNDFWPRLENKLINILK